MKDIILRPCCYVLELENGCWYVGITFNLNQRLGQHSSLDIDSGTAKWVNIHKYKNIHEVIYPGSYDIENETTEKYMKKYGIDKVKGGKYCNLKMSEKTRLLLVKKFENIDNATRSS